MPCSSHLLLFSVPTCPPAPWRMCLSCLLISIRWTTPFLLCPVGVVHHHALLFPFIALLCVLCGYLSAFGGCGSLFKRTDFALPIYRSSLCSLWLLVRRLFDGCGLFSSALIMLFPFIALLCFYVFPLFYNRHRIPAYTVRPYTGPQMRAASK